MFEVNLTLDRSPLQYYLNTLKFFPSPDALRRLSLGMADLVVLLGIFFLLALVARLGAGALVRLEPP